MISTFPILSPTTVGRACLSLHYDPKGLVLSYLWLVLQRDNLCSIGSWFSILRWG